MRLREGMGGELREREGRGGGGRGRRREGVVYAICLLPS